MHNPSIFRSGNHRIRGWLIWLTVLILICSGQSIGEGNQMTETEWYRQALKESEMRLGNNYRLKQIIERAGNGESITLAVIGGSVTEGAGADSYPECWASRFWTRFRSAFGAENGKYVSLINAGVGGTPSPFGLMRYQREIVDRVPEEDGDGLPDVVVIEYSVNDWQEPTGHRCYESMVKEILNAPNEPAVILLFAVFRNGFNLQDELRKIGDRYDLMMVSVKDGIFPHVGRELTAGEFFFDEYHPTSLGHRIMTDCLMQAVEDAAAAPEDPAPDPAPAPVYGTDFTGLKTLYGDSVQDTFSIDRGGFKSVDFNSYRNKPVGWVCGKNFFHDSADPMAPLTVTGVFRKCLLAWKASADTLFGTAEVLVDGRLVKTLQGGPGKWGQSEIALILDDSEAAEHTLEIRMTEPGKRFTVTAISLE